MADKKSTIVKFEHDGKEYEADSAVKSSYMFAIGVARASDDFSAFIHSMNMLFPDGRHMRYVEELGDDMEKFGALVKSAIEAIGAKN